MQPTLYRKGRRIGLAIALAFLSAPMLAGAQNSRPGSIAIFPAGPPRAPRTYTPNNVYRPVYGNGGGVNAAPGRFPQTSAFGQTTPRNGRRPPPNTPNASPLAKAYKVIELANRERAKQGLLPLKANEALLQCAMRHARDMADNNYFNHTDKNGGSPGDRARAAGYPACCGENIAAGFNSPESVLQCWMNSPGHRSNLLNPKAREIGVGVATGGRGYGTYWVQVFGNREDFYPVVINQEAGETTGPRVQLALYGEGKAGYLRLSNDGVNFTDWEPFRNQRQWTLAPGYGVRTVTVQLSDGQGRYRSASDSIVVTPYRAPERAMTAAAQNCALPGG